MVKKLTSIILSFSIVASLFAGLSFSVSAAPASATLVSGDAYGNKVYYRNTDFKNVATNESWDCDPSKSLIRGKTPEKVYYYINESFETDATSYLSQGQNLTFGELAVDEIGNISPLTNYTAGVNVETSFNANGILNKGMFVKFAADSFSAAPVGLINDEDQQYLQINYELDAPASIQSFAFGTDRASNTPWMIGHWKFYVADTEDELFEETNCVAETDMSEVTTSSYRQVTTQLDTPETGKWIGLRIICGYRANPTSASVYSRLTHFGVQGTYVNPATTEGYTATSQNAAAEAKVTNVALSGNTDKNGAAGIADITLSTKPTYTDAYGITYKFIGWYNGEQMIAESSYTTYTINGTETSTTYVAKYEAQSEDTEFEPYTDFTYAYSNKKGLETATSADKSLLADKTYHSAYIYNRIEGDYAITEAPQSYTPNSGISALTSVGTNGLTDAQLLAGSPENTNMFITQDASGLVETVTDSEDDQWVQINYELDGEADINTIVFGALKDTNYYKWMPKHYKIILSKTEVGLLNKNEAEAIIEVDADDNAEYKYNRHTFTLNTDVNAKYIGIRFICLYNEKLVGTNTKSLFYSRITHFGVHGTYNTTAEANVAYTVEGGAPDTVVTKAEPLYTGNADSNGKYAEGTVTLTATEQYIDTVNEATYDFDGWYIDGEPYSTELAVTCDLTKEDINLTAKYTKGAMLYFLDFIDASGEVISSLKLEKNAVPTAQQLADINSKVKGVYGYEIVTNEYGIEWGEDVYHNPVTQSVTYYARYKNLGKKTQVNVYDLEGQLISNVSGTYVFDSAVNLTLEGATCWKDVANNVVVAAAEGTLYACGNEMNIYAANDESPVATEINYVGKAMENGEFSVFVHINPTKTVKGYGVIFSSDNYKRKYDVQSDKGNMFTLEDTEAFEKVGNRLPSLIDCGKKVQNAANADYLATLTNCAGKTRHARAYIIYDNNGIEEVVYGDVISNQ